MVFVPLVSKFSCRQTIRHLFQFQSSWHRQGQWRRFASQNVSDTRDVSHTPSEIEIDGGKRLARLAKMAQVLQQNIDTGDIKAHQPPETVSRLKGEINEAHNIIRSALDKSGRPCTIEELAERTHNNIVPISVHALDYKDYLRATGLRTEIEDALINLQIFPPREGFLDHEGKAFCRFERRKQRDLEQKGLSHLVSDDDFHDTARLSDESKILHELRPVTQEELERRKEYLEKSTTMEHILRGYDTVLLEVGRVHKVVKEGTTLSMRALVAIGNRKGVAGYGEGKSETAQHAIERACRDAKRNLLHVNLHRKRTIKHRVKGKFVCSQVSLWPKPEGSGITGNNNFLAIFHLFGLKDVGAKQYGSRNLINSVKALFNALSNLQSAEDICRSRGIDRIEWVPPRKSRSAKWRTF